MPTSSLPGSQAGLRRLITADWAGIQARSGCVPSVLPSEPVLLTVDQLKLQKGEERGFKTAGLQLSPATEAFPEDSCLTLCAFAGICAESCVKGMGQNAMTPEQSKNARIWRTTLIRGAPELAEALLVSELVAHIKKAERLGLAPASRLNAISDRNWRPFINRHSETLRGLVLYDYTKDIARAEREHERQAGRGLPWHLSYSVSELTDLPRLDRFLASGGTAAVVFETRKGKPLPATWRGAPVEDGDLDDLTFRRSPGSIHGLRFKSLRDLDAKREKAIADGFCKLETGEDVGR